MKRENYTEQRIVGTRVRSQETPMTRANDMPSNNNPLKIYEIKGKHKVCTDAYCVLEKCYIDSENGVDSLIAPTGDPQDSTPCYP